MTLHERVEAYKAAFPKYRESWPWLGTEKGQPVLYAVWVIGNAWSGTSAFYGAYPRSYLQRVMALFPDVIAAAQTSQAVVIHAFSGSLPPGLYARCDVRQAAEFQCAVTDLPAQWRTRNGGLAPAMLALADPPYSQTDATKYGTPMVNRGQAVKALAQVVRPGGHLVWLDVMTPIYSLKEWRQVGRVFLERSTNNRVRKVSIFERQ